MDRGRKCAAIAGNRLAGANQVVLGARSELSFARRIEKGLRFATQLLRARVALKDCDRVGASARVAGRMRV